MKKKHILKPTLILVLQNQFLSFYMLSGQGSNLESSDPESDVLPIPPPDNKFKTQNYNIFPKTPTYFKKWFSWIYLCSCDLTRKIHRKTIGINIKNMVLLQFLWE